MLKYCFLNGKIVDTTKPHIFLDDIGILRGFGVFDFFRVYKNVPFMFKEHYERLVSSATTFGLKVPFSEKYLRKVVGDLLKKNKVEYAHVRMILTGGKTIDGLSPSKPTFYILFEQFHDLPASMFAKGIKIITHEHQRFIPESKNINYMQAVLLQDKKKKAGAYEILYVYKGKISETTTSNIFIVKAGKIFTPKQQGILNGLTRQVVINLAKDRGFTVTEKDLSIKDVLNADEVFLTATNKKVLSIVQVDDKKISNGKVGEVSKVLCKDFNDFIERY